MKQEETELEKVVNQSVNDYLWGVWMDGKLAEYGTQKKLDKALNDLSHKIHAEMVEAEKLYRLSNAKQLEDEAITYLAYVSITNRVNDLIHTFNFGEIETNDIVCEIETPLDADFTKYLVKFAGSQDVLIVACHKGHTEHSIFKLRKYYEDKAVRKAYNFMKRIIWARENNVF